MNKQTNFRQTFAKASHLVHCDHEHTNKTHFRQTFAEASQCTAFMNTHVYKIYLGKYVRVKGQKEID